LLAPKLDGLASDFIDEEASSLERLFKKSEVLEVVKGMNNEKALDPDGFTMAFFKVCWNVIKVDVMGMFHGYHARSNFEKSLNATFIALIPKKPETIVDVKDFRPISLVSGIYKIIVKVLANRLRRVMEKIISKP
jgi:hypothetical protein